MDLTFSSPPSPVSRQRWFVLGLLVLFMGLSIPYTKKVLDSRSALVRWREQLLALDSGEDIYLRYNYPNPPIMALLLRPLAALPPVAGALTWFYLKVAMTLVGFYWVFRMVEHSGVPFPPWAKALTVLLSLRPIMGDLSHGNVNLFILFLVLAALYTLFRGHKYTSGLLLGLAIACKVTPALFVPYFLWKRAWKTLIGCAIGLCFFLGPVPALFLGWDENKQQLHNWAANMVVPYVMEGVVTSPHQNQSLPGLIHRLTTNSPSFITFDDDKPDAPPALRFHNLLALDPALARWIVKGAMLIFVFLVIWTCRTPLKVGEPKGFEPCPVADPTWMARPESAKGVLGHLHPLRGLRACHAPLTGNGGWRLVAEFSLIVLGMLLFSERTWKHHCVTLVLPFAVLSYFLFAGRPGLWLRAYLIASLALTVLLMTTTSTSLLDALGGESAKMAQVYGAYVWSYLVLIAALVVLLRQTSAERKETQPRKYPDTLVKPISLRLGGSVPRFLEVWAGSKTVPQ